MKPLILSADLSKLKTDLSDDRLGLPSASAAPRLARCPGSWRMEMNQPQIARYAGEATRGQRIHDWLAGKEIELEKDELADAISIREARLLLVQEWAATVAPGHGINSTSVEERWFLHSGMTPVSSGQWDYVSECNGHYLDVDYKSGWQELPPTAQNLQLRLYALLVWQKHPDAKSISVAILRPGDDEKDKRHFFTYSPIELESAWQWWSRVLDGVFSERAPIVSGEHCQFCKAQFVCPARIHALSQFRAGMEPAPTWAALGADQKADLYGRWRTVKSFGASLEDAVRRDLESGVPIPGYSIGKGKMLTEISDATAAYNRFIKEGGTHEEFMALVKVSYAQMRDLLAEKKKWKKKEANNNAKAILTGLVENNETKGSIESV